MTALKPIEARRVKGVSATKYKVNRICSHPECSDPVSDRGHHIFPRSQIGNDSYFVLVEDTETFTIPHVTGLCAEHHRAVELHDAWIKLEDDQFVWYDRVEHPVEELVRWEEETGEHRDNYPVDNYVRIAPINPQPGSRVKVEKKAAKKRERFKGEARRSRRTVSYAVPQDEREDGAGIVDDLLAQAKEKHGDVPDYYIYVKGLYLLIMEEG